MIGYASQSGIRTSEALRARGWGIFRTPESRNPLPPGIRYALDNGAWHAYLHKTEWDSVKFRTAFDRYGEGADFVVLPDVVGDGVESLQDSLLWLPRLRHDCRLLLLPVQDGMKASDVQPYLNEKVGIFVGGTTEWKLRTIMSWGAVAARVGCYLHVGRVNSAR